MSNDILNALNSLLPCNSFDNITEWLNEALNQGLINEAEKSRLRGIDTISFFNHQKEIKNETI